MHFALLFPLISLALAYLAAQHRGPAWLLLWPALSFLLVGIAYALNSPRIFGKRPDGTLNPLAILLLLPFLLYTWLLWHLMRQINRLRATEPRASQITPTIWVGRRLYPAEIPSGITCIVNATCEFPAPRGLSAAIPLYLCLPILDHAAPPVDQILPLLHRLHSHKGPILFHCAQGHGRSALLAAAHLLSTGTVSTPDEAATLLKARRPNMRFS